MEISSLGIRFITLLQKFKEQSFCNVSSKFSVFKIAVQIRMYLTDTLENELTKFLEIGIDNFSFWLLQSEEINKI